MEQENSGMLKGLIIGLLAGGAVGALVALLYAPKSGRELRADIKEKADGLIDGADQYLSVAKSRAGEIVSDAKKRSDQLITDAKHKADSLLEDADRIISDARTKGAPLAQEGARLKNALKAGIDAFKEKDERRKS
jgi:gas vesicle protein